MPRRARDEEFEDDYGEVLSGDTLCEQWREFIDDNVDDFDLVPSDYGALSESYLDAIVRNGPHAIESEARVAFAEALYQKYSVLLAEFMTGAGRRGVDPRAEAESCGGNFFWDSFVVVADKRAKRNVWDLFEYGVVVIRQPTFPLHYERYRAKSGRIAYKIIKDANYIRFSSYLASLGFSQENYNRLHAEYESEGVGFAGGYVKASDIVKRIMDGASYISVDKPIIGVFDWETSSGAMLKIHGKKLDIPFSDMIVDVDGTARDAYERRRRL